MKTKDEIEGEAFVRRLKADSADMSDDAFFEQEAKRWREEQPQHQLVLAIDKLTVSLQELHGLISQVFNSMNK